MTDPAASVATNEPTASATTSTAISQRPGPAPVAAGITPPDSVSVVPPGVTASDPPQVLTRFGRGATNRPAGSDIVTARIVAGWLSVLERTLRSVVGSREATPSGVNFKVAPMLAWAAAARVKHRSAAAAAMTVARPMPRSVTLPGRPRGEADRHDEYDAESSGCEWDVGPIRLPGEDRLPEGLRAITSAKPSEALK